MADTPQETRMMMFHVPDDADLLTALAKVTLRHSHLDYILRMTVKSVAEVTINDALEATNRQGSALLRKRVVQLARKRLGDGPVLIQLQALLERCRRATELRNEYIHSIWAQELDGDPKVQTESHEWKPLPTVDRLNELAATLAAITNELNEARLHGFLAEALAKAPRGL